MFENTPKTPDQKEEEKIKQWVINTVQDEENTDKTFRFHAAQSESRG